MYLLGYDLGSSSVKACLLDVESGKVAASAARPGSEMKIVSREAGWAEQDPGVWWSNLVEATSAVMAEAGADAGDVKAIGISYQMHGLVAVDKAMEPVRDAIIWCDSRAVGIGEEAFAGIGEEECLRRLLNSPGNFTASKLKWVKDNEPGVYERIYKVMLPGDWAAMRMTGEARTTVSGLSEGILWDFEEDSVARAVLDFYGIDEGLLCERVGTFAVQGELRKDAAGELGLEAGTAVTYRAGDQPNNAFSLNVLRPGEIAATAGTSGVVYGVGDRKNYDQQSRVNVFAHLNYEVGEPRYGVLLCVNGTGILNSWLKNNAAGGTSYEQMNEIAAQAEIGSRGLAMLPYGNGAERTLGNRDAGCSVHGLNFNIHGQSELLRAGQEGIVFALNYGLEIMEGMEVEINTTRAGIANMFLSPVFCEAYANTTGSIVELYNTDGSAGAARAAGLGAGIYGSAEACFAGLECVKRVEPAGDKAKQYREAYERWAGILEKQLERC
jgi:xylulokinase